MIHKQVLPETFNFGVPSVELIGVGSKGLDKTAMEKRASAFDDVLDKIEKKPNRTYLHVITTGAFEKYGANNNCFVAGTKVTTENGWVLIEDIKVGDKVKTADGTLHTVIRTIARSYTGEQIKLTADGLREPVVMTANHPVKTFASVDMSSTVVRGAGTLTQNDILLLPGKHNSTLAIQSIERFNTTDTTVYNLEVEGDHTYCVPFVVHNCDAWNGESFTLDIPEPEDGKTFSVTLDGGLSKYHDDTYMKGGAVYQEHQTKRAGVDPSGEIVCARYNPVMQRGELLIAVDTSKWATRLQKKASGKDIYLSIGADVPRDLCTICGRSAKTASQHCEHFTRHRGRLYDCGKVACVMNDSPNFYDISGVDVPADRIAFVLQKVASGAPAAAAYADAVSTLGARTPMLQTKAASILSKLSKMEKKVQGIIEGDKDIDLDAFKDDEDKEKDFVIRVMRFPADEVIDGCSRKGMLLSPYMLFKLLFNELPEKSDAVDCIDDNGCCGDLSCALQELEEDDGRNAELLDGSFDQHFVPDLSLDAIQDEFAPEFCMHNPAVQSKTIRIVIAAPRKERKQKKEASFNSQAQTALRRTYARYLISFAEQNPDATCMNALMKVAAYNS